MMTKERAKKLIKMLDDQAKRQRVSFLTNLDEAIAEGTFDYTALLDDALSEEEGVARAKATLQHYLQTEFGELGQAKLKRKGAK